MKADDVIKDVRTGETGTITSTWVDDTGMVNVIVEYDHKEGNVVYWALSNGSEHRNIVSHLEIIKEKK